MLLFKTMTYVTAELCPSELSDSNIGQVGLPKGLRAAYCSDIDYRQFYLQKKVASFHSSYLSPTTTTFR